MQRSRAAEELWGARWRRRWRTSRPFRGFVVFTLVFALLAAARAVLPFALRKHVNGVLGSMPGHEASIGKLDLRLWRGAYEIEDVHIRSLGSASDEPFLAIQRLDLEVHWAGLLRGQLVAEALLHHPRVSFLVADGERGSQTGEESSWAERLDALLPFRLERFVVRDGEVRFASHGTDPPVDLYMTDFFLEALNLSNVRGKDEDEVLLAQVEAAGRPFGTGELEAQMRLDPLADPPRFELDAVARDVQLIDLNDLLAAYGSLDAEAGTFEMAMELAASDGRIEGYVKTIFEDVQLLSFGEIDDPLDALEALWEGLVEVGAELLENQPRDRVATLVPLRGELGEARADLIALVANLLRNAFIAAFRPAIDESIELSDLEIAIPEAGERGRKRPRADEDGKEERPQGPEGGAGEPPEDGSGRGDGGDGGGETGAAARDVWHRIGRRP